MSTCCQLQLLLLQSVLFYLFVIGKRYFRTTMSVQKFNDLMILSVHRNCTESLNVQKIASVQCLFQEIRNAKLFLEKCDVCLIMIFFVF